MRDARGSVSLVALTGGLLLCTFALGAADLGSILYARARAQTAADAAALAAIAEQVPAFSTGTDPDAAARDMAARDGGTLTRCDCARGSATAHVVVTVTPHLIFVTPWFGTVVHAEATAEVDADVLTYRAG